MRNKKMVYIFIFCCMCICGCNTENIKKTTEIQTENTTEEEKLIYENSMELSYAENFSVDYYKGGYKIITTSDKARFLVVPEGSEIPKNVVSDIKIVQQPVKNIYLVASASMCLFQSLDVLDSISLSGVKEEDCYIDEMKKLLKNGTIKYAGKYNEPDYELILSSGCNFAVESTMLIKYNPEVKEKLEELGITVFTDWSSYEKDPLARTEWIKLYAAFMNKETQAEEIFNKQEEYVKNLSNIENINKKVAFFSISSQGYAIVRKSGDYVTKMITSAGAEYVFNDIGDDETATSTVPLEMEKFYEIAKDADYIIYNGTIDGGISSIDELISKSSLLKDFKAVKNKNVWCTDKSMYQETTEFGKMIYEMHKIFTGDTDTDLEFFYSIS